MPAKFLKSGDVIPESNEVPESDYYKFNKLLASGFGYNSDYYQSLANKYPEEFRVVQEENTKAKNKLLDYLQFYKDTDNLDTLTKNAYANAPYRSNIVYGAEDYSTLGDYADNSASFRNPQFENTGAFHMGIDATSKNNPIYFAGMPDENVILHEQYHGELNPMFERMSQGHASNELITRQLEADAIRKGIVKPDNAYYRTGSMDYRTHPNQTVIDNTKAFMDQRNKTLISEGQQPMLQPQPIFYQR